MKVKRTLGKLQPGDEIFEKVGRRIERIGVVESIERNVPRRSITVSLVGGGGFSQNWAASVLVEREARRKIARDLPGTADWPLAYRLSPRR